MTCVSPFAGHEVVTASATTGAVGTLGTVSAICPASKRALSGGYASVNNAVWRVWRSRPVDAGAVQAGDRGWSVSFIAVVAGQGVTVHAVCATPATNIGYEMVMGSGVTGAASSGGAVSVICPGTKRVLGGGYSSENSAEVWRLRMSRGVDAGGVQVGNRGWAVDFTSVTAGQNVTAYAVCAAAPADLGHEVLTANATTGANASLGTVTVFCPATKRVLGGGYLSANAAEVWWVWWNHPVAADGEQAGDRGWSAVFTSVVAGQTVSAYAVCGFAPN